MQATIDVIDLSRRPLRRLETSCLAPEASRFVGFLGQPWPFTHETLAPDFDVLSNDFGRRITR